MRNVKEGELKDHLGFKLSITFSFDEHAPYNHFTIKSYLIQNHLNHVNTECTR